MGVLSKTVADRIATFTNIQNEGSFLRVCLPPFVVVIDGEAVLLGVDGRSDFNGLHSRRHDDEVQFYAFDILVSDGEDVRKLPLSMRKTNLARLLARANAMRK